ncbi:SRPBCC family protein [Niabella aquatica]
MRIVKKTGFILLMIVITLLVAALFVKGTITVEQSVEIHAPVSKVWDYTSTIRNMNIWSPWFTKDEDMQTKINGIDGKPGARFCWESRVTAINKGCLSIAGIRPQQQVYINLSLYIPYQTAAKGYIKLESKDSLTRVTLKFYGKRPYPLRIMKIFGVVEKTVSSNFTESLRNLKMLCEEQ